MASHRHRTGSGQPHEVRIVTSDRGLDRAVEGGWLGSRPQVSFDSEVLILLVPAVSESCPGLIFEGLVINDDRVYGLFEPAQAPRDACTSDTNPIAFAFVVDRDAVPRSFTLSVENQISCGGCLHQQIAVELDSED